jgi:hypothetical protein
LKLVDKVRMIFDVVPCDYFGSDLIPNDLNIQQKREALPVAKANFCF